MELKEYHRLEDDFLPASALTIGNFDGVHLGHRRIIGRLLEEARKRNLPAAVMTFEPHPREVLSPRNKVPAIMPFSERARRIAETGVDFLLKVNFTPEFARKTAEEFLDELEKKLHPRVIVIGHDFRFGKDREGDEKFLRKAGAERGFEVISLEAVSVDRETVSSSRIRELIQAGEVEKAARLLGTPFSLEGRVIPGRKRGKSLGFPTANLACPEQVLPPDGVYAAFAVMEDGTESKAVVNIGDNPTFGDKEKSIEAHLIGQNRDIYGKPLRLLFLKRLREERKFSSPDELKRQIEKDISQAKRLLPERLSEKDLLSSEPPREDSPAEGEPCS